jgi:hypothetical protein
MEESTLEALGESVTGNNEWVSTGILVQVHESIDTSSEATEVDIASTIGFTRRGNYCLPFDKAGVSNFRIRIRFSNFYFKVSNFLHIFFTQEVYWFPATYNSNDESVRSQLQRYLTRSCQAPGFTLVVNTLQSVGKNGAGVRMSMMCDRGRVTRLVSKHVSNFEFECLYLNLSNISRFRIDYVSFYYPVNYYNTTKTLPNKKAYKSWRKVHILNSMFTFRKIKVDGSSRKRVAVALHTSATVIWIRSK